METSKPGRANCVLCSGTSAVISLEHVSLQRHSVMCTGMHCTFYELKVARVILHLSKFQSNVLVLLCAHFLRNVFLN